MCFQVNHHIGLLGSFSSDDGDGGEDTLWKTNLHFTFECRNFSFSKIQRTWSFHVVVLQRTEKKCPKIQNARAQPLLCSLNLLFGVALVTVSETPCCSVRDWTRFLRHRIKKYPDSPVHTLSDSLRIYFFPLWRAYLFFSGFAVEFAGYGTKKLRIRKYPDTCGRGLKKALQMPFESCSLKTMNLNSLQQNFRIWEVLVWNCMRWVFQFSRLKFVFGSIHPGFHFLHENNPFPIHIFRSAPSETAANHLKGFFRPSRQLIQLALWQYNYEWNPYTTLVFQINQRPNISWVH